MPAPIVTVDCEYVQPLFAAAYLVVSEGRAAFIDNNTAHCVPLLLDALEQAGLGPEAVEWIVITHVHLDHAGGTSRLASLCPNARVLAHPKAARHVIDPSRLVASARKVYGEEAFEKLYGEIQAVPEDRVRAMEDGESVRLGSRDLRFLHTRGHANHHFCVHDVQEGAVFTGDAFGLRYPALQGQGLFVFPSTSPTDFDADEARKSVDRIVELAKPGATGVGMVYPTHFGGFSEIREAAAQLKEHLDFSERLLERARERYRERGPGEAASLGGWCASELREHYRSWLEDRRRSFGSAEWELLSLDLELNGDGVAHVARKPLEPPR